MASSSRSAARAWPFALNWLRRKARPNKKHVQDFEEYIAGIGMLQANEERRRCGFAPLEHAIIITGIHTSPSDKIPHVTIAAATRDMKARSQHIVVHSRVTSEKVENAYFRGCCEFADNIRQDDTSIEKAYADPVPVRTSLMSTDADSARVGCTADVEGGVMQWYVLDAEQEMVCLEADKFYSVGEGARQYLAFWNPVLGKPCRAVFLGNERPEPHSPDPQPTNLESGLEHLSIAYEPAASHEEWVYPVAKLGKDVKKSVCFEASDGRETRTNWDNWERFEGADPADPANPTFRYQGRATGNVYWAAYLPGQVVIPWWDGSSDRPIRFYNENGVLFKTKRKKWFAGKNESFYVYLEESVFYMAVCLPSKDDE